jgi:hypothetical protein
MPYVPRPATTIKCAHCKTAFESRHASRKYCSNSCNVLASYARTGYRGEPRASRADLERALAKMMELMKVSPPTLPTSKPTAPKPAPKAQTKKPAAKAAVKPAADAAKREELKAQLSFAAAAAAQAAIEKAASPAKKPAKKAARRALTKKPAAKAAVKPAADEVYYGDLDARVKAALLPL